MSNIIDEIKDEEIEYAEKILLPEGEIFDKERRDIIKELGSCSVEACPGSGKTTVLLAKLVILANRMPLEKNKGICILTHTNVAIEEIKKRLGAKSDILFQYPNYFGTLQSFIDKFLAIPCYKEIYKKNVEIIDDDIVTYGYQGKYIGKELYKIFMKDRVEHQSIVFDFKKKAFRFGREFIGASDKGFKFLNNRLERGYLRFGEAIQLGSIYIDNHSEISNYFSERFSLIMVDEMQDTKKEDFSIIERGFDKTKTSVQYIGDSNQNIYDGVVNWATEPVYNISQSKRYGKKIAEFLCPLRKTKLESTPNLKGNEKIKSHKPCIILFEDNEISKVIETFLKEVKNRNLHKKENFIGKVVGHVGKKNGEGKNTIPDFFKEFIGNDYNDKLSFNYLSAKESKKVSKNKELLKCVVKVIVNFFKKENINKEYQSYRKSMDFFQEKNVYDNLKYILYRYIIDNDITRLKENVFELLKYNSLVDENKKSNFFDWFTLVEKTSNIEVNKYCFEDISVEISTVHSVKGETHTATLFLETYNRSHDIEQMRDYIFKKRKPTKKENPAFIKKMNIAYVGFSRSTDLLCIACRKTEKIEELIKKNQEYVDETFTIIRI